MDTHDSDAVYYRKREKHERDLAEQATVEEARIIHQAMADEYRSLFAKAERREPRETFAPRVALESQPV